MTSTLGRSPIYRPAGRELPSVIPRAVCYLLDSLKRVSLFEFQFSDSRWQKN